MEVTTLKHSAVPARPAPGPLLRLASDERLVALIRRGHHAAFEALVQRYQSRLLSFCRHMLASREDAEDVLQEVFAAAFNAILADDRNINVRPWLYRIARNRSLNHLRRATAVGMDSMDTYFADHGQSVPERILQRESFQGLVEDIGRLAETQRTALLLREMDALSYEQIADVMETTVPSVKSLLVRARVALAEAAEARQLSCEEVRVELAEVAEGLVKISPPVRRHVRDCQRCRSFNKQLKHNERTLAALAPVGGIVALMHKLIATKIGTTTGGAYAAGGSGATASSAGVAAGAGAASTLGGVGGLAGLGSGAIAAKAVAGLAAAALLTAGAVEVGPGHTRTGATHKSAGGESGQTLSASVPAVVSSAPQALTVSHVSDLARTAGKQHAKAAARRHKRAAKAASTTTSSAAAPASGLASSAVGADAGRLSKAHASSTPVIAQVVEVTTSTTALPSEPPAAPVLTTPNQPSPSTPPAPEAGSTGPTGPTGVTEQPPTEAEAPSVGGATEAETGGSQAPPSAGEAPPVG